MVYETKLNLVNKIKILLAGGIAEELLFGADHASIWRSLDREQATRVTIDYIRQYGFDDEFQAHYMLEQWYSMDKSQTDLDIEKMIAHFVSDTRELLSKDIDLLRALSHKLMNEWEINAQDMMKLAHTHGHNVETKEEGFLHITEYSTMINTK